MVIIDVLYEEEEVLVMVIESPLFTVALVFAAHPFTENVHALILAVTSVAIPVTVIALEV